MNNFKITETKIFFTKQNKENEINTIQNARDFANEVFEKELLEGKTIFFNDWNVEQGYINYHVD